jgi:hypothetical protein
LFVGLCWVCNFLSRHCYCRRGLMGVTQCVRWIWRGQWGGWQL